MQLGKVFVSYTWLIVKIVRMWIYLGILYSIRVVPIVPKYADLLEDTEESTGKLKSKNAMWL